MTRDDGFDRRLDARLRRAFAPPHDPLARVRLPDAPDAPRPRSWRRLRAAAAALAALGLALIAVLWARRSPAQLAIDDLYAAACACAEQPAACASGLELSARLRRECGVELGICGEPALQGPYTLPQWPHLSLLLQRADGGWICVALTSSVQRPVLARRSPLRVHERKLGATTLWEISPLAEPRCLASFEEAGAR
jgi:hypothetical protein